MAKVTVAPEKFELIDFDSGEIAKITEEVADAVGLPPECPVTVNVDEAVIMGRATAQVLDGGAVLVDATGGAFESLRKARVFDAARGRAVLGHAMQRAADRLNPDFGSPPADGELTTGLEAAWSTYIEGRLVRHGIIEGEAQRRIYHFRVRHAFTDTADEVFHRLWDADDLTWADIEAASAEAAAAA